jgi:hypothetical protein
MRAPERSRAIRTTFNRIDQGRQPVRHIQRSSLTTQDLIAQGTQHLRQVAEPLLAGRVLLTFAVAAHQRDEPVGGSAFGVEVVEGRVGKGRVG